MIDDNDTPLSANEERQKMISANATRFEPATARKARLRAARGDTGAPSTPPSDDEIPNADKARKDLVKFNKNRFVSADERKARANAARNAGGKR